MTGRVLLTGADGYLGRRTAARFLAATDHRLVLAVRAGGPDELARKKAALLAGLGHPPTSRVQAVPADLTRDAPLAGARRDVTCVVHGAARAAFNVSRDDAQRVNVDGTLRVARFAGECPGLERFVFLSTLLSAGRRTGDVAEEPLDDAGGFANHYEWSKQEAERRLLAGFPGLPLTVARLATIIADDDSGRVTQYNAFHNTMRLFFYGLLTLMPGLPSTPLYLATAEFTSRGIVQLGRPEAAPGIFHLAPAPDEAVTLADVMDVALEVFETDPGFLRRRLPRPEFCDLTTFQYMVTAAQGLSASPAASAMSSVAPFAEQMFRPKTFANDRLRASWPDAPAAACMNLVRAVCENLVRTRWGRRADESLASPAPA